MLTKKVNEDDIYDAAVCVNIHDVIEGFENGYDTTLGKQGVTLSGGQKQRVVITRTIITNLKVLIFDDSYGSSYLKPSFGSSI